MWVYRWGYKCLRMYRIWILHPDCSILLSWFFNFYSGNEKTHVVSYWYVFNHRHVVKVIYFLLSVLFFVIIVINYVYTHSNVRCVCRLETSSWILPYIIDDIIYGRIFFPPAYPYKMVKWIPIVRSIQIIIIHCKNYFI